MDTRKVITVNKPVSGIQSWGMRAIQSHNSSYLLVDCLLPFFLKPISHFHYHYLYSKSEPSTFNLIFSPVSSGEI